MRRSPSQRAGRIMTRRKSNIKGRKTEEPQGVVGVDSSADRNPGAEAREKPVSLKPLTVEDALRGLLATAPDEKGDDGK